MTSIDISEMDERRNELIAYLTERKGGSVIPLLNGGRIVLDELHGRVEAEEVLPVVRQFISESGLEEEYSVEKDGEEILIRSRTGKPATRQQRREVLPPGVQMCPFCGFVTKYQEEYSVHIRIHGFF